MVSTSHSHPVICILAPKRTHGNIHTNSMKIHFHYFFFSDERNLEWLFFETNPDVTKEAQFSVFPQKQKLICLGPPLRIGRMVSRWLAELWSHWQRLTIEPLGGQDVIQVHLIVSNTNTTKIQKTNANTEKIQIQMLWKERKTNTNIDTARLK